MPYFPFFINIEDSPCLVVGGGKVAARKIEKLIAFKPKIQVVAIDICQDIMDISGLNICRRSFESSDLYGKKFVIAATENNELNSEISRICNEKNILCNVVDRPDKCSFYFPALAVSGDVTVGISTAGKSPALAAYIRSEADGILNNDMGKICDILGEIRLFVKESYSTEKQRKKAMLTALELCVTSEKLPSVDQIKTVLENLKEKK